MIINHLDDSTIWYHSTPKDRLESILEHGLKINSPPTYQSRPEPWIYLSPAPWEMGELVILQVNLDEVAESDAGWAFTSPEDDNWDDRWQLRVMVDIPTSKIIHHNL